MIAIFFLVLGILLMVVQWRKFPAFFRRRPEVVPAGFLEGEAPAPDTDRRRPGGDVRMSTIVVGYDGSDCGEAGARHRRLGSARTSATSWSSSSATRRPGIWGGEIADHEQAIEDLGEQLMNEAKGRDVTQGVDFELEMIAKHGPQALIEAADARDARMIVVGSYGESALKGVMLGSTPHKLLHIAERPVLVVPAER